MTACDKSDVFISSITISHQFNIPHNVIIEMIENISDKEHFLPIHRTLENGPKKIIYSLTPMGAQIIEDLLLNYDDLKVLSL